MSSRVFACHGNFFLVNHCCTIGSKLPVANILRGKTVADDRSHPI